MKNLFKNKNSIYRLVAIVLGIVSSLYYFTLHSNANSAKYVPASDIVKQSLEIVNDSYFNRAKLLPKVMFKRSLQQISQAIPPVLVDFKDDEKVEINVLGQKSIFSTANLTKFEDLEPLTQEVLRFIKQSLPSDEYENLAVVDYAAINGALAALDPHSNLLTPEIYRDFSNEAQGEYAGVGMVIREKDGKIEVTAIIGKNSPARKVGMLPKDLIIQIDSLSTAGLSVEDAKNKLRGPKNSVVNITVERPTSNKPLSFSLTRDDISLPSVSSYKFERNNKKYGYIQINRVIANSAIDLKAQLTEMGSSLNDFGGLVLDLRNNPGGLLNAAIEISNTFLNSGDIVSIAGVDKENIIHYRARPFSTVKDFPVVVLVNRFSASAAEIIAGALQKNNRAIVIGERTFGKGTVQSLVERFSDGSGLKITTSQYLTPGDESIQSVGITPDIHFEPVLISKDILAVLPLAIPLESELENSFISDASSSNSSFDLRYLDKVKDVEDLDQGFFYGEVNQALLENDYLVTSAVNILEKSKSTMDNGLVLKAAVDYAKTESGKQQAKVVDAFKAIGVDWSDVKAPGKSAARLKIELEVELQSEKESYSKIDRSFPPSSNGRLKIIATNQSGRDLEQVIGKIISNNPSFSNKQYVFGKIAPGATKVWYTNFKTEKFNNGDIAELTLKTQEGVPLTRDTEYDPFTSDDFIVNFEASKNPRLALDFSLPTKPFEASNPAEPFDAILKLTNIANTPTGTINLSLKNADFTVLEIGRSNLILDGLAAGQSISEKVILKPLARPVDGKYDLKLGVLLQNFPNSTFEQSFSLDYGVNGYKLKNSPPQISFANSPSKTTKNKVNLEVLLNDDTGIKEFFLFLGEEKIYYSRLSSNPVFYKFDYELNLKESSDLTMVVFDKDSVRTQSRFHIVLSK